MKFIKTVIFIILGSLILSCTAHKNLDRYPQRHIDRPYTLPEDVYSYSISSGVFLETKEDSFVNINETTPLFPNPLIFNFGITDNVNIGLNIIMPTIQIQLYNAHKNVLGFSSTIPALGNNEDRGFFLISSHSIYHRLNIQNNLAIETTFELCPVMKFREKEIDNYKVDASIGILIQTLDSLALTPLFRIHNNVQKNQNSLFKNYPIYTDIGSKVEWRIAYQWELISTISVTFNQLEHHKYHQLYIEIFHYW